MKEFCTLRAKTYSYLMDDGSKVEKSKGTKREIMFETRIESLCLNIIQIVCLMIK